MWEAVAVIMIAALALADKGFFDTPTTKRIRRRVADDFCI